MNWALSPQPMVSPTSCYWLMFMILPVLLAASMARQSTHSPSLPDENSYRSSQSDMAVESSSWRSEATDYNTWREPPPPASRNWRSTPRGSGSSGSAQREPEYFPEYKPGDPAFYNHRTGEQEDQIKVFEFGR